jgi:hypothetical protein
MKDYTYKQCNQNDIKTLQKDLEALLERTKFVKETFLTDTIVVCVVLDDDIDEAEQFNINNSVKDKICQTLNTFHGISNVLPPEVSSQFIPTRRIKYIYKKEDYQFGEDDAKTVRRALRNLNLEYVSNIL